MNFTIRMGPGCVLTRPWRPAVLALVAGTGLLLGHSGGLAFGVPADRTPLRPSYYPIEAASLQAGLNDGYPLRQSRRGGFRGLLARVQDLSIFRRSKKPRKKATPKRTSSRSPRRTSSISPPRDLPEVGGDPSGLQLTPLSEESIPTLDLDGNWEDGLTPLAIPDKDEGEERGERVASFELGGNDPPVPPEADPAAPPKESPRSRALLAPTRLETAGETWTGGYHTLRAGETLSGLSRDYGVPLMEILSHNTLDDPDRLPVGARIFIPPAPGVVGFSERIAAPDTPSLSSSQDAPPPPPSRHSRTSAPTPLPSIAEAPSPSSGTAPASETPPALRVPGPRQPTSVHRAKFIWPVKGPVTSGFGLRQGIQHNGIDIAAPRGTPVKAARSGRVLFSSTMKGYGNVVILDHGDGMFTVYGHNSKNLVEKGTEGAPTLIAMGEEVALVGETGNANGPHVHFEVRRGNRPLDPMTILPAATFARR